MAHTALTFLFALAHNLLPKDHLVRTAQWDRKALYRGPGLATATVGVIGLGGIGQETVRQLRALNLEVVAWNRSPRPDFCAEVGITQLELDEVLERSDYVILTVSGIGFAAGTTAGNSIVTPAIIASADPRFEQYVDVATVQVATAVLISAVTAPLIAAWFLKRNGALSNPEELEDTDAASVPGASSPSHLEAGAEAAEASAPAAGRETVAAPSMAPDGTHAAGVRPAQGAPEGRRGPEATARGRRRREPEDS